MIAAVTIMATLSGDALGAEDTSATLTPAALAEIARVEAEIDRIEAQTLERLAAPPDNQVQQIELLGELMLYDKDLSVNRNEACAFFHMPETGFTGPVSELNQTNRYMTPPCDLRAADAVDRRTLVAVSGRSRASALASDSVTFFCDH